MDFNNDSTRIIVCGKAGSGLKGYEIFSIPDGALLYSDYTYIQDAQTCRFSMSNHFAVGDKNGGIYYYASPNTSVWNYTSNGGAIPYGVAFTPNGSILGSGWGGGGSNKNIFTFNSVGTNVITLSYSGSHDFKALDYSPDGFTFASGDNGGNIRIH
jgi:WD40 repeat protein